jgi:DNA end-binding protein Ku
MTGFSSQAKAQPYRSRNLALPVIGALSHFPHMPARPIWRGHLRLALVSCPVALWNAKTDRSSIRFNLINPETGNRIRMVTVDADTEKEVQRRDLVKGYEFQKGRYLTLSAEDFDSVKVESSSVMAIDKFVEVNSIDPIYYASSYYLAPDGDAGRDVYAVLHEAMAETGRVALARVVVGQRERTIAVRSMDGGLVAHALDEQRDINDAKAIFGDTVSIKTDPEMVQLAKQLIDRQTTTYDASDLEDHYETRLRAMIDAKLKGEGIDVSEPEEPDRGNVIDLMAALKKSLGQTSEPKPAPAKKAPKETKPRAAAQPAAKAARKRA